LRQRGLDFLDAPKVFASVRFSFADERFGYPEPRYSRSVYSTVEW
jgi:hypothetical protein